MNSKSEGGRVIVSYLTLRRTIGVMGVLLPVLLAVGCIVLSSCSGLQTSISAYYGTAVRDILVGILFVIAWFLFSYRGYERKDDIAGDFACVLALGVALFPTTSSNSVTRTVHFLCAMGLFLVLAYFSICLFTKTKKNVPLKPRKKVRNRIYVTCGVIMLVCIASIGLYQVFLRETPVATIKPVFWLESLALWAFGWSWFVKGETLWRDSD